jgi:hypothetical protein
LEGFVTDSLASVDPGAQKRRSTRIAQAVPITVAGVDALGQPFKERTTTVMVNCHGCKYQSKHYVPKNSLVVIDIAGHGSNVAARSISGRVIWVQRPRTVRELFQIGLEFEVQGNVWGIAFPPEDWTQYLTEPSATKAPATEAPAQPAASETPVRVEASSPTVAAPPAKPEPRSTQPVQQVVTPPVSATPTAAPPQTTSAPAPAKAAPAEGKIHLVPTAEPSQEALAASRQQIAKLLAEAKETIGKTARQDAQAAINDEMTVVRQQLDAQLHDAVERAIKSSMERASESAAKKLVQQTAERTTAIVEEARKATEANAGQLDQKLDLKIRSAVDQAVTTAAESAAKQAAQMAATQNLQSSVEEVVERVIAGREANSPSLKILSSPEAAQQHLDSWKMSLEETAQAVRHTTLEQSQADATAAAIRLHNEMEAAISGASQKLGEKLDELSQARISQAEAEVAARAAGLRSALDETIAGSQAAIQSLSAALEQERARAGEINSQLTDAAQTAVDRARSGLDELLAGHSQEVARKADEIIAERTALAAPGIESSAQQAVERFSREIDRTLAPKIDEASRMVSELSQAGQQAAVAQQDVRTRMQRMAEQAAQVETGLRDQIRATSEQAVSAQQDVRAQMDRMTQQAAHLEVDLRDRIRSASEQAVAESLGRVREEAGKVPAEVEKACQRAAVAQQEVQAQIEQMTAKAARVETGLSDRIREVSEQAVAESLGRVREEAAKVPAEVEQACQSVVSRIEAELEKKTTEAQHETYESLSKAADWYQKKAHTTMQSSLEKAVDQSAANLRDRAAEISSLAASELDHHRRTYAEHSRAEIEETASEIVSRERERLTESAAMVNASLTDQVQRVAAESLRRFQEVSREALEKSRSDMEFNREGALSNFQNDLDRQMTKGVQQAQIYLESQLAPLVETWEARRNQQQREWMELLKKSTDESIDHYKTRLENASNSWLLASATTLGQNSQAILDTLAKSAEKRLRETCSDVLAGIGDTIKDRLMGISTGFSKDEEEEHPPSSRNK